MIPTVAAPKYLQFRPAVWTLGPPDQIQDLPLITGDSSGAATSINDHGQIVGISGCLRPGRWKTYRPRMPSFGKMAV